MPRRCATGSASGPKTLAARQAALANRQAELEAARKALQDTKVQLKKHEHSLQGVETKIDDLKVKLNQVKKNEEYKALQNQIAHDNTAKAKIEEEILAALEDDRDPDRRGRPSSRPTSSGSPPRSPPSSSSSTSRPPTTRPSSGARDRDHAAEDAIPEDHRDTIPPDRRPLRGRRPGRLRGWLLPWLLSPRSPPR